MALQQIGLQAVFEDADFQNGIQAYEKDVKRAGDATDQSATLFSKLGTVAQTTVVAGLAAAAIGIGAVVAAAKGGVDALLDWNDQVNTLSDSLGTSGEESSKWAVAFNHVGLSVDEGTAGLNFFTRGLAEMGEAAKGPTVSIKDNSAAVEKLKNQIEDAEIKLARANQRLAEAKEPTNSMKWAVEDAAKRVAELNEKLANTPATITKVAEAKTKLSPFGEALGKLGIKAKDAQGNLRTFDDIMPEIMTAFQNLPAGIDKSALAMELFGGRAGTKFLDFLSQGADGLASAEQMAKDFGLTLTTEGSNAAEEFTFAMNDLQLGLKGVMVQIGIAVLPILREFADFMAKNIVPILVQAAQTLGPFIAGLFDLIKQIGQVLTTGELFEDFGADFVALFGEENQQLVWDIVGVIGQFAEKVHFIFSSVFEAISNPAPWGGAATVIKAFVSSILTALGVPRQAALDVGHTFAEAFLTVQKAIGAAWDFIQPILDDIFKELAKFWEEIQPKLAAAFENIQKVTLQVFGAIAQFIRDHSEEIRNIFEGAWKIIQGIFKTAWALIEGIVKIALDLLAGDFEAAGKDFNQMMEDIWSGIQLIIEGAWQEIQGYVALALNTLGQAIWDKLAEIGGWFNQQFDSILNYLASLPERFVRAGFDLMQGLIDGFWQQAGAIQDALASIIQAAVDNLWTILTGGGGGPGFRAPLVEAGVSGGGAVRRDGAEAFRWDAGRAVPSYQPASFNQGLANSALQTIQIYFQGTGGPATQAEAETQGNWIVNAMVARGVRF